MRTEYIHRPAFGIIGSTRVVDAGRLGTARSEIWKAHDERCALIPEVPRDESEETIRRCSVGTHGACISTCNDTVEHLVGGIFDEGTIPQDMQVFRVPEGDWAVFSATGPACETMDDLQRRVWTEWYPEVGILLTPCGDATIEHYGDRDSPDCRCELWVMVRRRPEGL
ncbi:MAG: GyrI-like domain-containing protein [archaeon]|nr:GyrI-like domain-containing protein [archaeon]